MCHENRAYAQTSHGRPNYPGTPAAAQGCESCHGPGLTHAEFLFPYPYPAQRLKALLDETGLELVLHNLPAGDWQAGERGIACLPDRREEFRDGVGLAIDYAKTLGCPRLNTRAGIAPEGVDRDDLTQVMVDNLRFAAEACAAHGITLLIEPINTTDIPGFFLCHTEQAVDIIGAVGADNLKLQYDIYHMQIKRTFNPGFRIALHQKDLNVALSGARALGVSLPNTATTQELFNSCAASGWSDLDHSALVKALEKLADHTVTPD